MPDQLDQPLPDSRLRWLRRTHPAHASRSDGFGRFAEATARFMGSPKFVLYMSIFVAVWIVANLILAKMQQAWDPYPFILLNLAFSTQASYSAPLIMLGVERVPTQLDGMIVPPVAHGVKVISIGMFVEDKQPVVWRGPMLHRAVQQFLSDVFWGDLDVLLLDLPPGTGDVTISVAQLLPNAEILVVTTPQTAAAEVAERTGLIATQTHQKVVGVIENMSYMPQPDGSRLEIFGSGGGEIVSASLSETLGYEVPLLAQLPLDIRLREGSDTGLPATVAQDGKPAADAPAALELSAVAQRLTHRSRGLAGKSLGVTPA